MIAIEIECKCDSQGPATAMGRWEDISQRVPRDNSIEELSE